MPDRHPKSQQKPYEGTHLRRPRMRNVNAMPPPRHADRRPAYEHEKPRFVGGPTVRARYGITDMSLWRWLHDTKLGFPQPAMRIRGRRYWNEADLIDWETNFVPREAVHA